jgi:hypothetical protein
MTPENAPYTSPHHLTFRASPLGERRVTPVMQHLQGLRMRCVLVLTTRSSLRLFFMQGKFSNYLSGNNVSVLALLSLEAASLNRRILAFFG